MTKSPYPLLDSIMVWPLLAYANIYFGSPVPEVYVAIAMAVSLCDIVLYYSTQMHHVLGLQCVIVVVS